MQRHLMILATAITNKEIFQSARVHRKTGRIGFWGAAKPSKIPILGENCY